MWGKCWSALGSISAAVPGISVQAWRSTDLILVAGAAGAQREWMCFSGRMSHLGLDTLWCLKHILKCDTPSTYLLAVHNNPGTGCWSERVPFRRIYRVWYGVEAPRWHGFAKQSDTVCSLSLIPLTLPLLFCHLLSEKWGADWNGVGLLLFHFWLGFSVLIACHFPGALCCCFFFCCCCFHLTSDSAHLGAQLYSTITVHSPQTDTCSFRLPTQTNL